MNKKLSRRLSDAPLGKSFRINSLNAKPETSQRLREIGFSESTVICTVVKNSSQMICEVHNTRIGLHKRIANEILVSPVDQEEPLPVSS